ncbi:M16 family metallopeptidase [Desulforhopalus singaporensis]|uniref:Zinc protease n=1 Tax=Desulforhopalus singaporensis TaxID=91360 RepID=A0A1H0PXW5_9BACT|nr:insulinase family protein [Desulforhopalus singaporensis]SDP10017.1 zinc protease [Desulforhopalus singaporensis]
MNPASVFKKIKGESTVAGDIGRLFFGVAVLVAALLMTGGYSGAAQNRPCQVDKWPYENSDLAPDPTLYRDVLDNGFRVILKHNEEPRERVALFLHIRAGSLNETENQQGVAHFLEHLVFNGSTNFPPGSLVNHFQSLGMNFGSDTNAFTSFDQTVFYLVLPSGSKKNLEEGLRILGDYAYGALLLDSEIDKERGVVLAEKSERNSADYKAYVAEIGQIYRGTRYPDRMVIGKREVLEKITAKEIKKFYHGWYRPENMTLVGVGDFETELAGQLVRTAFGDFKGYDSPPACPDFGDLAENRQDYFYYHDPALGATTVSLKSLWDTSFKQDRVALERQELNEYLGQQIVGYRLKRLSEERVQPYVSVDYGSGKIFDEIGYGGFTARTDKRNWQKTLNSLVTQLRRIEVYGFLEKEVDRAKRELIAELDRRVQTEKSTDSRFLARTIVNHVSDKKVYMSPGQERKLYGSLMSQITADEVTAAFLEVWNHDKRIISIKGDVVLGDDARQEIEAVYLKALGGELESEQVAGEKKYPYLQPAENLPGTVEKNYYQDIDVTSFTFPGGLVVNFKKTDFEKNTVRMVINYGYGELAANQPGLSLLTKAVVNGSGSGALTASDLQAIVGDTSVRYGFDISPTSFAWQGTSLSSDFENLVQLLHTLVYDPGCREVPYRDAKKNFSLMYKKLGYEIEGAVSLYVDKFLSGDNPLFGLPPWSAVQKIGFGEVRDWVKDVVALNYSGQVEAMEISVVGDIDKDVVGKITRKYFGGVTVADSRQPEPVEPVFPAGKTFTRTVATGEDKALVLVAWPTARQPWSVERSRRLTLLAQVFEEKLREVVREELGASYSPRALSYSRKLFPGYGYILARIVTERDKVEKVRKVVLELAENLVENTITDEEVGLVKKPFLTAAQEYQQKNDYWLDRVLAKSSRDREQLRWPPGMVDDLKSVTAGELTELAGASFLKGQAAVAVILPGEEDDVEQQ